MPEKILTVIQAAKRLDIPLSTLRSLVRHGTLRATSMESGDVGLSESEIQRFLDRFEKTAQVELADSKSVDALLRTPHSAGSVRSRIKKPVSATPVGHSQEPKQRCRCGNCQACQDADRWERIFQEKFADPDYYARRVPRHGSSLSWML